jgi:hypothetical protein
MVDELNAISLVGRMKYKWLEEFLRESL